MTSVNTFDEETGVDHGTYADDDRQGDGLVRIQWRQGDPKAQTPGYFFLDQKSVPEGFAPSGENWKSTTEYFELTRTRSEGWKAEALPMCIICARAQPYQRPPQGSDGPKVWLDTWPKGAPSNTIGQHADVLLIADGLEKLGPVCWSTNSTTVAFAIISGPDPKRGPQGGILHRLREEVLAAADRLSHTLQERKKKRLYWLFWVTIASQRDAKGAVVFTPTAGKDVTLPVPQIPATVDAKWLSGAYSGKAMAQYGEDMRAEYDIWRQTRYTNEAQIAKATNGHRNIPQPIEAVDEL